MILFTRIMVSLVSFIHGCHIWWALRHPFVYFQGWAGLQLEAMGAVGGNWGGYWWMWIFLLCFFSSPERSRSPNDYWESSERIFWTSVKEIRSNAHMIWPNPYGANVFKSSQWEWAPLRTKARKGNGRQTKSLMYLVRSSNHRLFANDVHNNTQVLDALWKRVLLHGFNGKICTLDWKWWFFSSFP